MEGRFASRDDQGSPRVAPLYLAAWRPPVPVVATQASELMCASSCSLPFHFLALLLFLLSGVPSDITRGDAWTPSAVARAEKRR